MATLPISESAQGFVPVEEYLRTTYEPDCDYVDGRIEERNLGEYEHGRLQLLLGFLFMKFEASWGVRAVTEVRTRINRTRYRIPDISVLRADAPRERIISHPQLIAIEVLSPADRPRRMQEKFNDYMDLGVEHIWVFDAERRMAWTADRCGLHIAENGELTVPGTPIRVGLGELFAELDAK
jgi:Uma2 family endonuclease